MESSKVCPSCGAVNSASNLFCIHCGKPFDAGTSSATTAYPTTYPPGYPAMPPPGAPPGAYPYFGPPPRRASASSILSAMFDVWTKNFVNFFVVFFIVALVNGLIGLLLYFAIFNSFDVSPGVVPVAPPSAGSVDIARLVGVAVLLAIVSIILNSIIMGGMTEYAVRRYRGETIEIGAALRRGLERFLSILGASILLGFLVLAVLVIPFAVAIALIVSAGAANPAGALAAICGAGLAIVVGGIIAVYVYIGMSLYAPTIMVENQRAIGGLSRSWQITKGTRWSLFWAILAAVLLSAIIQSAITYPAGLARNAIVSGVAGAIASGIVGGWLVILAAVAYVLIVSQPTPTYGPPPYMPGPMTPPMTGGPPSGPPGTPPSQMPPTGP